jgi:hypothetical protein
MTDSLTPDIHIVGVGYEPQRMICCPILQIVQVKIRISCRTSGRVKSLSLGCGYFPTPQSAIGHRAPGAAPVAAIAIWHSHMRGL